MTKRPKIGGTVMIGGDLYSVLFVGDGRILVGSTQDRTRIYWAASKNGNGSGPWKITEQVSADAVEFARPAMVCERDHPGGPVWRPITSEEIEMIAAAKPAGPDAYNLDDLDDAGNRIR